MQNLSKTFDGSMIHSPPGNLSHTPRSKSGFLSSCLGPWLGEFSVQISLAAVLMRWKTQYASRYFMDPLPQPQIHVGLLPRSFCTYFTIHLVSSPDFVGRVYHVHPYSEHTYIQLVPARCFGYRISQIYPHLPFLRQSTGLDRFMHQEQQ